jgi:hypothetical protein
MEGLWIYGHPFYGHIQRTIYHTPVPINEAGAKVLTERVEADNAGKPVGNQTSGCRPAGPFHWYRLHFPIVILQSEDFIYMLSEQYHGLWEVRMNQKHRTGRYNSGDSIGHWDGDTLVIETTQFSEPLWIDMAGLPLSIDGRITYRVRKIDEGQSLEIVTSVYDPTYYSQGGPLPIAWCGDRTGFWVNTTASCSSRTAENRHWGVSSHEQAVSSSLTMLCGELVDSRQCRVARSW